MRNAYREVMDPRTHASATTGMKKMAANAKRKPKVGFFVNLQLTDAK